MDEKIKLNNRPQAEEPARAAEMLEEFRKDESVNDRDCITMGPAGASFHHEGPGNDDQIMWVTMNEDGPEISKINLYDIFDRHGRDLEVKELYQ